MGGGIPNSGSIFWLFDSMFGYLLVVLCFKVNFKVSFGVSVEPLPPAAFPGVATKLIRIKNIFCVYSQSLFQKEF